MPAVATASIPSSRMLFEKYFAMCEANWLIGSPAVTHAGSPPPAGTDRGRAPAPGARPARRHAARRGGRVDPCPVIEQRTWHSPLRLALFPLGAVLLVLWML